MPSGVGFLCGDTMLNDLDLNLDLSLFDVKHGKGVSNRYCKPKKFKSVKTA